MFKIRMDGGERMHLSESLIACMTASRAPRFKVGVWLRTLDETELATLEEGLAGLSERDNCAELVCSDALATWFFAQCGHTGRYEGTCNVESFFASISALRCLVALEQLHRRGEVEILATLTLDMDGEVVYRMPGSQTD